jgi:CDP-diacylglycerol--serine O-phosphatidyltransferase
MFRTIKAYIPNTITCLNLLSGTMACVMAFNLYHTVGGMLGYEWAFLFIGAAAVFDFLDGAMARLLHAYSDMGKELDSLSDLVSFGLAPAMLVFNYMNYFHPGISAWSFISLFMVAMGALRLAKFNIDTRQTTSFIGLPIPANAIFWVGMLAWLIDTAYPGDLVMAVMVVGMSLLMVCNLPMFSLKFKNFNLADNYRRYLIIIAAVLFVGVGGIPGLAWTIMFYLLLSLADRMFSPKAAQ